MSLPVWQKQVRNKLVRITKLFQCNLLSEKKRKQQIITTCLWLNVTKLSCASRVWKAAVICMFAHVLSSLVLGPQSSFVADKSKIDSITSRNGG